MKYKMSETGQIEVGSNGHSIVIQDSGDEIELRATELFQTKIPALNAEAKRYREEKADIEKRFNELNSNLDGVDISEAKKAMKIVQGLESKDLINSVEANKKRDEIVKEFQQKIEALQAEHTEKYKGAEAKSNQLQQEIYKLKVSDRFKGSPALKGTIFESAPELAIAYFGNDFKLEDGDVIGYNGNNRIMNPDPNKINEVADFDQALKWKIDNHQNAKAFKFAGSGANDGSNPHLNNDGGSLNVTRDQIRKVGYANILKKAGGDASKIVVID